MLHPGIGPADDNATAQFIPGPICGADPLVKFSSGGLRGRAGLVLRHGNPMAAVRGEDAYQASIH